MSDTRNAASRRRAVIRLSILVVFVAAAAAVGFSLPPFDLDAVRRTASQWGPLGAVIFLFAYAGLTLTPVPKNLLSIAAGVVWGFGVAAVIVYLGALVGAATAFVIGRRLGRDAVERLTGRRMARLDDALARRGLLAVLGVRLVPLVPFTVINYGAGLTAVRVRDYALGTALGIIPGTVAYVALGAYGFELGAPFWIAVAVLGILSIVGAVAGIRMRRRAPDDEAPGDA